MAGAALRRTLYKDTLQPALHRRFSSTATLLIGIAYLEALTLASWNSLIWSWLPLGSAGIRTGFIFACGLAILILRIAHYHVGFKTETGLQTLKASLFSLKTYETLFWYGISSSIFCIVYLSSLSESSGLQWVSYYSGDRARLNERPIFLVCYLATCALTQTTVHYIFDLDRLVISKPVVNSELSKGKKGSFLSGSSQMILQQFPSLFAGCIKQSTCSLVVAMILYYTLLRSSVWSWALMFFRPFYSLQRSNIAPSRWPADLFLLLRCVWAGALLNAIWAAGNTAFSIFMARAPLKAGKPLTTESKDPNSSLLNGLKSKKPTIQCFAMWELAIIAQDYEAQRKAIFADIDRKDGSMWSQVYFQCMSVLESMEYRVDTFDKPLEPVAPTQIHEEPKQRISAPPKQDEIFTKGSTTLSGVEKAWDQIVRSPGSSPMAELSPLAKKTWKSTRDKILSKEQQAAVSPESLRSYIGRIKHHLLEFGWIRSIFYRSFRSNIAKVLGEPYAEPTLYAHAAQALCHLAIHSLKEDEFGNVHRDVPTIIRTLTNIIRKTEALKAQCPIQWINASGQRECPEVDEVLDAMRVGLGKLIANFEPYSSDLKLSMTDIRLAKEAMVKPEVALEPKPAKMKKEKKGTKEGGSKRADLTKSRSVTQKKFEPSVRQRLEQRRPEMEQVR